MYQKVAQRNVELYLSSDLGKFLLRNFNFPLKFNDIHRIEFDFTLEYNPQS